MAKSYPGTLQRYRWKELGLLIVPFLILLLEITQLLLENNDPRSSLSTKNLPTIHGLLPVLGLIATLLTVNVVFSFFFRRADQLLLPLVGLLSGIGMLMATRIGPDINDPALGTKQLTWVILGLFVCIATMFILRNLNWLRRYKYTWAFVSILVLLPSVIEGIRSLRSGAPTHDTLNFGPLNLQPSELLKISIVVFFAAYLSENRDVLAQGNLRIGPLRLPPLRQLGPIILMVGLALLIFLVVRELGLALLIYGLFLTMMYLGSGKLSYVIGGLLMFAVLGLIGYSILSYVRFRFIVLGIDVVNLDPSGAFLKPSDETLYQGSAFQIVQGLIALCSGGILGAGLGLGHPAFVSVVQSDMVFTALGEELGLVGLFAIIGIYLLIIYRGYRIAIEANDTFQQLLAAGLTSIFAIQTLIIAAGNMKFLPLTGIPLPFLSYGGSSVIANYIIIGILLRISNNTALEKEGLA